MAAESDRLARRSNHRHRKTRRSSRSQATYPTFRLNQSTVTTTGAAGYAKYIGRVGALAVALGVGAAVATGHGIGVARADDTPSTKTSPTTNTQGEAGDSTLPPSKAPTTEPASSPTSGQSHSEPTHSPSVPEMNFSSSGGARTSGEDQDTSGEDQDTDEEEPSTQAPESPNPPETVPPPTPTDAPSTPQSPVPQDNSSPTPPTPTNTPPAEGNSAHTNAGGTSIEGKSANAANAQSRLMRTLDVQEIDPADGQQQLLTANTTQRASALSMTTRASTLAAPVNPVGALLAVPTTIINIAAGVVAAFLSPFLAPGPATPAEPPLLWAVLAWVRREVQRTFFNRSPVAIDNAYTTSEDSGLAGNVLTDGVDDTDADGDPLTATVVTGPQHGTLVLNPNGSFTYTPTANYSGTDTFTYKVSDETGRFHMHGLLGFLTNSGHSDTATVSITVTAVNEPPIANPDTATTAEDTAVSIDVLTNDSDPENNTLTPVLVTPPAKGTLVATANGWTYTPNANVNGTDSFSYKVNDGIADSNTATVSITITPVDDPPTAPDVTKNVETGVGVPINLLNYASDPDGDPVSVTRVVIKVGTSTIVVEPPLRGEDQTIIVPGLSVHWPSFANPGVFTYTTTVDGPGTIEYTVTDGNTSDVGIITINAAFVNDDPVANPDTFDATEDTTLVSPSYPFNLLGNDFDNDDQGLSVENPGTYTTAKGGTVTINTNGNFTYIPAPNFSGTGTDADTFTYTITDGFGGHATGTATINVAEVLDNPSAVDDEYNIDEGETLTVTSVANGVLDNDSDGDGDVLTAQNPGTKTTTWGGTVQLNANGTFTYTPASAEFSGPDSFTYTVIDTTGRTDTATVTIDVAFVNDDPVANPDTFDATEDTTLVSPSYPFNLLRNDFDNDDQGLSVENPGTYTTAKGGTVDIDTNGNFTYIPAPNFSGTGTDADIFTYTITDGFGGHATGTVTINVAAVNDAPVSVDDSYTMTEDGTLTGKVTTNDTDLETTDIWVVGPYTQPAHGTLSFQFDGSFTYTPNPNFTGTDTFTYEAWDRDPVILGNLATVTITVNPVDDAPVANDDEFTVDEDNTLTDTVLGNDTDPDSVLTATVVTAPTNGSLSLNTNGSFTYIPNANYSGSDSFTYRITGGALEDTATVSITVNAVNDAPVSVDDNYTTTKDTVLTGKVTTNDTDLETTDIWVVGPYTQPAHGTLSFQFDGSFTYTPNPGFTGTDTFTYKAWDRDPVILGNLATVTITVTAANQAPVAVNDPITTTEDNFTTAGNVLTNDTDADGNPLTIVNPGVITTAHGAVVLQSDGSFNYAPIPNFNGQDSFTYRVSDGTATSNVATVTINVTPVNDAPVALPNAYVATGSFTSNNRSVSGNVLTNTPADFDVDGDSLTAVLVDPPDKHNNGVFVLNSNGSFSYRANRLAGTDSFSYYVTDGITNSNTIIVGIVINPA
jgi:VCBS repeat-containing protein